MGFIIIDATVDNDCFNQGKWYAAGASLAILAFQML
jgi:hypothetical protein